MSQSTMEIERVVREVLAELALRRRKSPLALGRGAGVRAVSDKQSALTLIPNPQGRVP